MNRRVFNDYANDYRDDDRQMSGNDAAGHVAMPRTSHGSHNRGGTRVLHLGSDSIMSPGVHYGNVGLLIRSSVGVF